MWYSNSLQRPTCGKELPATPSPLCRPRRPWLPLKPTIFGSTFCHKHICQYLLAKEASEEGTVLCFVLGGVRLLDVGMIAHCTALSLSCEFHVLSWNTIWQKKIRQDASEIWYWTMIVLMGKCSIYHNWYFMDFTSCHQLRKAYEWDRKFVFLWICV